MSLILRLEMQAIFRRDVKHIIVPRALETQTLIFPRLTYRLEKVILPYSQTGYCEIRSEFAVAAARLSQDPLWTMDVDHKSCRHYARTGFEIFEREDVDRLRDGQHEGQFSDSRRLKQKKTSRVRNGYNSNGQDQGQPKLLANALTLNYKMKPLDFSTEGVVGLTRWFEKMESVFSISNCPAASQVKFATCTLQDDALTWWNSHVKTTTPEAAHAMTWAALKKMMTDKYCPRGEIKKIETEMWNLKVKGTDVVAYSRRFQQLALMCSRMFPEEVDKIEKYIGGLPDMILGSVKASKSKTMQEVIEFTTELMEDKTHAYAERQAERKRKNDDLSKNNQNQQNKRQNTGQAYTAGNSDRKSYAGSLKLCVTKTCRIFLRLDKLEFQIDFVPGAATVARGTLSIWRLRDERVIEQLKELFKVVVSIENRPKVRLSPIDRVQRNSQSIVPRSRVDSEGIHVDLAKIKSIKDWTYPKSPTEIRQFLGLAGVTIEDSLKVFKIANQLTKLTQKSKVKFEWGDKTRNAAFQLLESKSCASEPILALLRR
ncbi:reverse transcriptase domain-containing protein [Tanacetum coccineum]